MKSPPSEEASSEFYIPYAVWPDNLPHPEENYLMVIVACESHYRWAVYQRTDDKPDFYSILYWRTSVIDAQDMEQESATATLSRFLPEQTKELIYGPKPDRGHDPDLAVAFRTQQRIPSMTVYCLLPTVHEGYTSRHHAARIAASAKLLREMLQESFPCNVYQLKTSDFWPDDGSLRTADHLATLAAIEGVVPSRHCFLVDGGASTLGLTVLAPNASLAVDTKPATAVASSKTNGKKASVALASTPSKQPPSSAQLRTLRVVAHSRTVSMERRLQKLHEGTGALPDIGPKQLLEAITRAEDDETQLGMFATNTNGAMIGNAVLETILFIRAALKQWAETLDSTDNEIQHICSGATGVQSRPVVFIAGNEGDILYKLLTAPVVEMEPDPNFTWISPPEDSKSTAKLLQIRQQSTGQKVVMELKHERYMICHVLAPILRKHRDAYASAVTEDEKLRQDIRGRRVAKDFGKKHGGMYYGHVASIARINPASIKSDIFSVRYDDLDAEDYTFAEMHDLFMCFCKSVGDLPADIKHDLLLQQRNESARVADLIAARVAVVDDKVAIDSSNSVPALPKDGPRDVPDSAPPVATHGTPVAGVSSVPNGTAVTLSPGSLPKAEPSMLDDAAAAAAADAAAAAAAIEIRQSIVGCSIAKDFGKQLGGIFVGKITTVIGHEEIDDVLFSVLYEDTDVEDLNIIELHDHLNFYCSFVEGKSSAEKADLVEKRDQSHRLASLIPTASRKVQDELARRALRHGTSSKRTPKTGALTSRRRRVPVSNGSNKRTHREMD